MTNKCLWSAVVAGMVVPCALAQTSGSAAQAGRAVSDEVKRQADGPYRWILLHSRKEAKTSTPPTEATSRMPARPEERSKEALTKGAAQGTADQGSVRPTVTVSPNAEIALEPSKPVPVESVKVEPAREVLRLVRQISPQIPDRLMMDITEETVVVRCRVFPDGSVKVSRVIKSTQSNLNPHVVSAIEQWRYQPTTREHEVDVTVIVRP